MDRSQEITISWISIALIFTLFVFAIEGQKTKRDKITDNVGDEQIENIRCKNL